MHLQMAEAKGFPEVGPADGGCSQSCEHLEGDTQQNQGIVGA